MIKNQPDLPENLINYAKSFIKNTTEKEVSYHYTFHAEFIYWQDSPEYWASSWNSHVLCLIEDHSLLNLKSLSTIKQGYKTFSKYNINNAPTSNIDTLVTYKGNPCSRSAMTHNEYAELSKTLTPQEKIQWINNQKNNYNSLMKEIKACPSIEYPVKIILTGTDDTSYSICKSSRNAAVDLLYQIILNPTWDNIDKCKFIFTN